MAGGGGGGGGVLTPKAVNLIYFCSNLSVLTPEEINAQIRGWNMQKNNL